MAAGARSQLHSLFQGPVGNGSVSAGDQSANAIREGCDFGRRPVQAESVHERGSESVAGTHGIDDLYRVYGRFDVMPTGEYSAPAISQRDAYCLPPVSGLTLRGRMLRRSTGVPRTHGPAGVPPR